ncbi:MAG TPA: putative Ig domain-containing protein [Bryobacteraceae bacterium]|nr:putative Ig domain-containing protein [Bryobacteraceae bacterium]
MVLRKCFPFVTGLLLISAARAQLQITTSSVPAATQYQSYSATLTASGGTPPYSWSVVQSTGVSLPEGMSLNSSTGVVSATPVNGQGGYAVTIQVTDSASPSHNTATATLDFGVYSDTSLAGCQIFPPDSIYNQRVDQLPVDNTASHQIPSSYLNSPLHPDFGHGFYPGPGGIPWMRVPANQPVTNVYLANSGQIDAAGTYSWPFPAWPNAVIEGTSYGADGDDHHILILQSGVNNITGPQTGPCTLYETYQSSAVAGMFNAATNTWSMTAGIHYVLNSDEIAASESTLDNGAQDSPGIPMMPLLLRWSDVPQLAQHPLRITFPSPTNGWVWPGTGCCGGSGPPQGLLYRLKASVNWAATCPAGTNPQAATLLQTLQQYGAYMSDHGSAGYIQGVPDVRWNDDDLACIKKFTVGDLEVVNNSVLEVSDISGQTKPYVVPATLAAGTAGNAYSATLAAAGGNPATRSWSVTSGSLPPGLALNSSAGVVSGLISESAAGAYNFQVSATDTGSGYSSAAQALSIDVSTSVVTTQVAITVTSAPAGLQVTVDGTTYNTPHTFSWAPGSTHTLSAASPQGSGTRNVLLNWSDGGAPSHAVVVPATAATYTANFQTQYLLSLTVNLAGYGTIAASPTSADGYYNAGTQVKITATVATGRVFSGFSGNLSGTTNPQNLVMSAPASVTANFAPLPKFRMNIAHSLFTRSKSATYTVTVGNASSAAISGPVTVGEAQETGFTLVSMTGMGWTCVPGGYTCTRGDALAAGTSYSPITVTVAIAANTPSLVVLSATASGGGTSLTASTTAEVWN